MQTKHRMLMAGAALAGLAVAGCATVEEAVVEKLAKTYNASLTGAQEVAAGDPDGSGRAEVTVADALDQICYDIGDLQGLDTITAAHIHQGARGVDGPPVLTLKRANEGGFKGCESAPEWVQNAVESNFTGYYVNVHTTAYPNGAIRGQLGR